MQNETRIVSVLEFGASYIRDFTVSEMLNREYALHSMLVKNFHEWLFYIWATCEPDSWAPIH